MGSRVAQVQTESPIDQFECAYKPGESLVAAALTLHDLVLTNSQRKRRSQMPLVQDRDGLL